jgi:hypothetical protein
MAKSGTRVSWLDEKDTPVIDQHARQLDSFLKTMADGKVTRAELESQEKRLASLMKEIEPKLDDEMHGKITELLCELTAYDMMQILHAMQQARPKTKFRG